MQGWRTRTTLFTKSFASFHAAPRHVLSIEHLPAPYIPFSQLVLQLNKGMNWNNKIGQYDNWDKDNHSFLFAL